MTKLCSRRRLPDQIERLNPPSADIISFVQTYGRDLDRCCCLSPNLIGWRAVSVAGV